jgi:transposase InsO family protein
VLVEDISPASVGTDASAKLADYFRLPSLRYYLMVDPGRRPSDPDLATHLAAWQGFYNHHRPHGALGAGTPA